MLLRLLRLVRSLLHLVYGFGIVLLLFPFSSERGRHTFIRRWSQRLLDILGISLHLHGEAATATGAPRMLAANHVSWLDIFVILASMDVRFVSKSDVRRWPVIGLLAARAGTLFLERARKTHLTEVNHRIAQALAAGTVIAVFPEGTSTDGSCVLPFHASLLQPAVAAEADVQPAALRFLDARGDVTSDAAYDGDKTLLDSLWLILRHRRIVAELQLLAPVPCRGLSRRPLATTLERVIAEALALAPPQRSQGRAQAPHSAQSI